MNEHQETLRVAEGVALALCRDQIERGKELDAKLDILELKMRERLARQEEQRRAAQEADRARADLFALPPAINDNSCWSEAQSNFALECQGDALDFPQDAEPAALPPISAADWRNWEGKV